MHAYYMGIDPGLEGAIAVIRKDGKFVLTEKFKTLPGKTSGRRLDLLALWKLLEQMRIKYHLAGILATLENLGGSPGQGPKQIFSMGFGCGVLEMGLAGAGIPYQVVSPQKWKNQMIGLGKKEKDVSVTPALQLFPEASPYMIGPKGGRDHNVADALLIAEWARRNTK